MRSNPLGGEPAFSRAPGPKYLDPTGRAPGRGLPAIVRPFRQAGADASHKILVGEVCGPKVILGNEHVGEIFHAVFDVFAKLRSIFRAPVREQIVNNVPTPTIHGPGPFRHGSEFVNVGKTLFRSKAAFSGVCICNPLIY
jgi:hypothetical protein